MTEQFPRREISITRRDVKRYTAHNARGASLNFGSGDDEFSPVELLLVAIAGCSGVDVDVVTSRRATPQDFTVTVSAQPVAEDDAYRLDDIVVDFSVRFADDESGRQAAGMVDRLIKLSHEKDCTVSRTVELPTKVEFRNNHAG